jgi:sulfoxide reductase heme-binding subunit YedZ
MAWQGRHFATLTLAVIATFAFLESRPEWSEMHRWNRAFGDASTLLIVLAMVIGPAARLWWAARRLLPWRREFGIWGVILAAVHTGIILDGWVEMDLIRIFGYQFHPMLDRYVMLQHGFGLANILGILALIYGVALALTSNDRSQRLLGGSVWKFFQQGAYVLWALIVLHTAYFLYLHFQDFHRQTPDPNWLQMPFAAVVALVAALQLAAFWKTWRSKRRRPGRPQKRGNPKTSEAFGAGMAREPA